jgi:hypothetical protein
MTIGGQRMKLFAHVRTDGRIHGLVAIPEGKLSAMLLPAPGVQVCEIEDHGLKGNVVDLDKLSKLHAAHTVTVTPARGKLVRRKR